MRKTISDEEIERKSCNTNDKYEKEEKEHMREVKIAPVLLQTWGSRERICREISILPQIWHNIIYKVEKEDEEKI